jgi:hypothetical protein
MCEEQLHANCVIGRIGVSRIHTRGQRQENIERKYHNRFAAQFPQPTLVNLNAARCMLAVG